MDPAYVLTALLALPFGVASLIVLVSSVRRRRRADRGVEPVHRLQSGTAAVQDAVVRPAGAPPLPSGRRRRAEAARRSADGAAPRR